MNTRFEKCPEKVSPVPCVPQNTAEVVFPYDTNYQQLAMLTPVAENEAAAIRRNETSIAVRETTLGEDIRAMTDNDNFRLMLIGVMLSFAFISYKIIARILSV